MSGAWQDKTVLRSTHTVLEIGNAPSSTNSVENGRPPVPSSDPKFAVPTYSQTKGGQTRDGPPLR